MGRLLLLFIVVPAVELGLLIEVGSRIGTLATLGICLWQVLRVRATLPPPEST